MTLVFFFDGSSRVVRVLSFGVSGVLGLWASRAESGFGALGLWGFGVQAFRVLGLWALNPKPQTLNPFSLNP